MRVIFLKLILFNTWIYNTILIKGINVKYNPLLLGIDISNNIFIKLKMFLH
jgi:hypothetical protein